MWHNSRHSCSNIYGHAARLIYIALQPRETRYEALRRRRLEYMTECQMNMRTLAQRQQLWLQHVDLRHRRQALLSGQGPITTQLVWLASVISFIDVGPVDLETDLIDGFRAGYHANVIDTVRTLVQQRQHYLYHYKYLPLAARLSHSSCRAIYLYRYI